MQAAQIALVTSSGRIDIPSAMPLARRLTASKCKWLNHLCYISMPLILGVGLAGNFTSSKINSRGGAEGLMFGMNVLSRAEEIKADSEGLTVEASSITR